MGYMNVEQLFEIRINSTEENKDLGFEVIMGSGSSVVCLEDEKYVVPANVLVKLGIKGVKYEHVVKEQCPQKSE